MVDPYEKRIESKINDIVKDSGEVIEKLSYPLSEIGEKIICLLLNYACDSSNMALITLSKKKLAQVPRETMLKAIPHIVYNTIDLSDDWQYRRFVELIICLVPQLLSWILEYGRNSDNPEIREAVCDYEQDM